MLPSLFPKTTVNYCIPGIQMLPSLLPKTTVNNCIPGIQMLPSLLRKTITLLSSKSNAAQSLTQN